MVWKEPFWHCEAANRLEQCRIWLATGSEDNILCFLICLCEELPGKWRNCGKFQIKKLLPKEGILKQRKNIPIT